VYPLWVIGGGAAVILLAEIGILLANLVVLGLAVKLYTDQTKQKLLGRGEVKR
jgi:hypothetical protein